jgi:hypothetical protein
MDIDSMTARESNTRLFCMLSCVSGVDIAAAISDIDMAKISSDILRFICAAPDELPAGAKYYCEITVTNLSSSQNRKIMCPLRRDRR